MRRYVRIRSFGCSFGKVAMSSLLVSRREGPLRKRIRPTRHLPNDPRPRNALDRRESDLPRSAQLSIGSGRRKADVVLMQPVPLLTLQLAMQVGHGWVGYERRSTMLIAAPQCGQTKVDGTMATGAAEDGGSIAVGTRCSSSRAWARCSRRRALASRP